MSSLIEYFSGSQIIASLGWTILHFLWQGAALAGILGIALIFLRKQRPQIRYMVSCSVLALMLLCFAGTFLYQISPPLKKAESVGLVKNGKTEVFEKPQTSPVYETTAPVNYLKNMKESERINFSSILPWIVAIWLVGVAILSIRMTGGFLVLRKYRRKSKNADGEIVTRFRALCTKIGIQAEKICLLISQHIESPIMIGWLKPVIIVPASTLAGLSPHELDMILIHELAHVMRRDWLVNILQNIVETILFYHPAVWWVSHRIRVEREYCCDDIAAEFGGGALPYAKALTRLEELRSTPALSIGAAGNSLFTRISRLFGKHQEFSASSKLTILLPAIVLLVVSCAVMKSNSKDINNELDQVYKSYTQKDIGEKEFEKAILEIAEKEPEKASEWVQKMPEGKNKDNILLYLVFNWSKREPEKASEWASNLPPHKGKDKIIMVVIDRWLDKNPDAAVKHALSMNNPEFFVLVFWQWFKKDQDTAGKWLLDENNIKYHGAVLEKLAQVLPDKKFKTAVLAQIDFEHGKSVKNFKAIADASLQLKKEHNDGICGIVICFWIKADPDAAAEWVLQLPEGKGKDNAVKNAAEIWAQKDQKKATEWALNIPDGKIRNYALRSVARGLMKKSPEAAAIWVQQLPDGEGKTWTSYSIAYQWAQKEPEKVAKWAMSLPEGQAKDKALTGVARAWMGKAPAAAVKWLSELPAGNSKDEVLEKTASKWAQNEPEKAAIWTQQLPEGQGKENALRAVAEEWVQKEPEKAIAWVLNMPDGKTKEQIQKGDAWILKMPERSIKEDALHGAVKGWVKKNPEEALKWTGQLSDAKEKDKFRKLMIDEWAKKNPRAAAEWGKSLAMNNGEYDPLFQASWYWFKNDARTAIEWIQDYQLPDDKKKEALEAAKKWALQLPDGNDKAMILSLITWVWAQKNPKGAAEWALAISNDGAKNNVMTCATNVWGLKDKEATAKWIEQLPEGKAKDQAAKGLENAKNNIMPLKFERIQ